MSILKITDVEDYGDNGAAILVHYTLLGEERHIVIEVDDMDYDPEFDHNNPTRGENFGPLYSYLREQLNVKYIVNYIRKVNDETKDLLYAPIRGGEESGPRQPRGKPMKKP